MIDSSATIISQTGIPNGMIAPIHGGGGEGGIE